MHFKKVLLLFVFFIISALILPAAGTAELRALDDDEMTEIYATGFSDFQINDLGNGLTETYALFNIQAYTYTEIDSLKLGYHDEYNYKDPTPSYGWDEDWENVRIGGALNDPSQDFYAEKFYFSAIFDNIDDASIRELKSVKFGFEKIEGDIYADFINFSGTINDGAGAPEYNGHILNLGPVTITGDPGGTDGTGGMEISLNIENYDKGYWVTFDNAVVTP